MSPVGPAVFALMNKEDVRERLLAFLHSKEVAKSRIMVTEVENTGARIVKNGIERDYTGESWVSS
jgi:predicted sugar kinase